MIWYDWLILILPVCFVMFMGFYVKRYIRGVTDFLSAGRLCGRYVICVGDDYYLTASSFQCMPGLPVLHSRDLVNWTIIGYALQRQFPGELPQHGNGVWAPSIRYHEGQYYICWGDPDFGVMMVKTKNGDPAGEWEQPVCVIRGQGYIDTCPLWDEFAQPFTR